VIFGIHASKIADFPDSGVMVTKYVLHINLEVVIEQILSVQITISPGRE
jgi:hypothetical protein